MNEQSFDLNDAPTIGLREYGEILRRRRAVILQAFLFVLIVGIIWTAFQTNIYRASARLLIEPQSSGLSIQNTSDPLNELFKISQNYTVSTQVELLQTPDILKKVHDKVGKDLPEFTINSVTDTQIIQVDAESPDADLAATAANTLLEVYQADTLERRGVELNSALEFAKKQQADAQQTVNDTDKEIARFKRQFNVVELEQSRKSAADAYDAASNQYNNVQAELAATVARIAATKTQLAQTPATLSTAPGPQADPTVQLLEQRLADRETDKLVMSKTLAPESEKMLLANTEIANLRQRLANAQQNFFKHTESNNPAFLALRDKLLDLNTDAVVWNRRVVDAGQSMANAKKRIAELPNWEQRYNELMRRKDAAALVLATSGQHIGDLQIRMSARPKMATIIDRAQVPRAAIRPNRVLNIVFAAIIGLFLGFGLALLQELFDDRINSADEAERVLKLPSLGHIPMIEEEGLRLIRDISTFSPLMESYRTLRTNINFAAVGNEVRSMVVTSSVPAEGKSTTCANLAMAMAMDGKRVIIVDADLRRPSQHHLFKVDASPGLTDILIGSHTIDEVIRPTGVEGVFIIPAGSPPPNPAELLGSVAMGRFLAEVETRADIVMLDTPPTLAVADATVIAARTDGALLVVGYGDSKKTSVKRAKDMLARGNANILGTVLNRMDGGGGGYYYYGKYYTSGGYAPYAPGGKKSSYAPVGTGKKRSLVGPYSPNRSERKRIEGNSDTGNATATIEDPKDEA